ncbi:hypothetical protein GCM10023333_31450 [Ferrimonas pelagia]|uniref:Uncharacterized protein n=1 Tax=Ferrimonas pelagia TaxID=1177826 RepID=A0ABP9F7A6_9GAMM
MVSQPACFSTRRTSRRGFLSSNKRTWAQAKSQWMAMVGHNASVGNASSRGISQSQPKGRINKCDQSDAGKRFALPLGA